MMHATLAPNGGDRPSILLHFRSYLKKHNDGSQDGPSIELVPDQAQQRTGKYLLKIVDRSSSFRRHALRPFDC